MGAFHHHLEHSMSSSSGFVVDCDRVQPPECPDEDMQRDIDDQIKEFNIGNPALPWWAKHIVRYRELFHDGALWYSELDPEDSVPIFIYLPLYVSKKDPLEAWFLRARRVENHCDSADVMKELEFYDGDVSCLQVFEIILDARWISASDMGDWEDGTIFSWIRWSTPATTL